MWGGVTNHVDAAAVLAHAAGTDWEQPERLQILVRDEEHSWFRLYMLDDGKMKAYGPDPEDDIM